VISIVVSTYKPELFQQFSANVAENIGVIYEILPVHNPGIYSLCQAYNLGISKAKYSYCCFVHEDVLINTKNWGQHLINIMQQDRSIGLIGVAGSKFKSTYPTTGWGTGPFVKKFWRGHYKTLDVNKKDIVEIDLDVTPKKTDVEDVIIVDGVFLFTKTEVLDKCGFDENMLTHFHGYDTDFCLQVHFNSYRVLVDRNLDILHYSKGVQGKEFANANKLILKKWSKKLPVATSDLRLGTMRLHGYNLLVWMGYIWFALQRKLKLR